MPIYSFYCHNLNCPNFEIITDFQLAMEDISKPINCCICHQPMYQVWNKNINTIWNCQQPSKTLTSRKEKELGSVKFTPKEESGLSRKK